MRGVGWGELRAQEEEDAVLDHVPSYYKLCTQGSMSQELAGIGGIDRSNMRHHTPTPGGRPAMGIRNGGGNYGVSGEVVTWRCLQG